MNNIMFLKSKNAKVKDPQRRDGDAGFDLFCPEYNEWFKNEFDMDNAGTGSTMSLNSFGEYSISIPVGQSVIINTGLKAKFPNDIMLEIMNKSGIVSYKRLIVGANVIDASYEGCIKINFINVSDHTQKIDLGTKMVQAVPKKIYDGSYEVLDENNVSVEEFYKDHKSVRGEGGFGSTGV